MQLSLTRTVINVSLSDTWIGHILRRPNNRLLKIVLFGELAEGNRPHGAPKKRPRDHLKQVPKSVGIPYQDMESLAADRAKWRNLCEEGVASSKMKEEEHWKNAAATAMEVTYFRSKMMASTHALNAQGFAPAKSDFTPTSLLFPPQESDPSSSVMTDCFKFVRY